MEKKWPGPGVMAEFYLTFKEDRRSNSIKLLKKEKRNKKSTSNSFYNTSIPLIPKPSKDTRKKREPQVSDPCEHR